MSELSAKSLMAKRKKLKEEIDNIDRAIDALQKVCTHQHEDGSDAFEYEGHDSHHDYYVCSICGKERSV